MWFLRAFGHVIGQTVNIAINTHTHTHAHTHTHTVLLENLAMDYDAVHVTLS